jgi:hypothetical protein
MLVVRLATSTFLYTVNEVKGQWAIHSRDERILRIYFTYQLLVVVGPLETSEISLCGFRRDGAQIEMWPYRETDNSHPFSAEAENAWSYTSSTLYVLIV